MPEIGVWTTAEGTSEARLELESEDGGVTATELPGWVSDALKGVVAGAVTGAAGGPSGILAGAVTGGALGAASAAGKPAPSPSPAAAGAAGDASRTKAIQALQQFTTVVPALVQLIAASAKGGKESSTGDVGESRECPEAGLGAGVLQGPGRSHDRRDGRRCRHPRPAAGRRADLIEGTLAEKPLAAAVALSSCSRHPGPAIPRRRWFRRHPGRGLSHLPRRGQDLSRVRWERRARIA